MQPEQALQLGGGLSQTDLIGMLDLTHDCVIVREMDGTILYWNRGARATYGFTSEEALGRISHELLNTKFPQNLADLESQLTANGRWEGELTHTTQRGQTRKVLSRWTLHHRSPETSPRVFEINRDITDLAQYREIAEQSASQLQLLMDGLPGLVSYIDPQLRYRYVNRMYQEWFGKKRDQIVGFEMSEVLGEQATALIRPHMHRALNGEHVQYDALVPYETGQRRYIHANYMPDTGPDGEVRGVIALVEDITVQKTAEEVLQESELQFRNLADSISQLAWIANPDGHIFWYNRRWYDYTGTTPQQMEGWGWQSVHDPDILPSVLEGWKKSLISGKPFDMEFPLRAANGGFRWFLTRVSPVRDSTGRINRWFGTNTDIDELRHTREALRNTTENLSASNAALKRANADLEHFAYAASHDLQEPLRMVALYSQLMQRIYSAQLDERALLFLSNMLRGAYQMESLVTNLLALTRLSSIPVEDAPVVSAQEVLQQAINNLEGPISETGAKIDIAEMPDVRIHEVHLLQVFQNLIGNALKFRSGREPEIRITSEAAGRLLRICVQDNGIGIDPRYHQQIFGLFKRLHSAAEYQGSGLGLSICQRIIERYGGGIAVTSSQGEGATFCFSVPLADAEGKEAI